MECSKVNFQTTGTTVSLAVYLSPVSWKNEGYWSQIAIDTEGDDLIDTVAYFGFETANSDTERLSQSIQLQT